MIMLCEKRKERKRSKKRWAGEYRLRKVLKRSKKRRAGEYRLRKEFGQLQS